MQIVPYRFYSPCKIRSNSVLYSQTAVLLIVEEDNDNPNIFSIRFLLSLALLTLQLAIVSTKYTKLRLLIEELFFFPFFIHPILLLIGVPCPVMR